MFQLIKNKNKAQMISQYIINMEKKKFTQPNQLYRQNAYLCSNTSSLK